MNPRYKLFILDMKRRKATPPYMAEKDYCEAHGLQYGNEETPIFIARKSSSVKEIKPTLKAHIEIKPPKEKRTYKFATNEEERRLARTQYTRQKRAEYKEAGLNSNGKPFKNNEAKNG